MKVRTMSTISIKNRVSVGQRLKKSASRDAGIMLKSDESYERFSRFIDDRIKEVENNSEKAIEALVGTGMYDKNGKLKKEFR